MTHWNDENSPNWLSFNTISMKCITNTPRALFFNPQMQRFYGEKKTQEKSTKEWFENLLNQIGIRCLHFGRFYWITILELWFVFSLLLRRCFVCVVVVCCFILLLFEWTASVLFIDVVNIRFVCFLLFWLLFMGFSALHTKSNVNKYKLGPADRNGLRMC